MQTLPCVALYTDSHCLQRDCCSAGHYAVCGMNHWREEGRREGKEGGGEKRGGRREGRGGGGRGREGGGKEGQRGKGGRKE